VIYKFQIGDLVEHKYASKKGTPLRGYVVGRGLSKNVEGRYFENYFYRINWFNLDAPHRTGVMLQQGIKFGEIVLKHVGKK